MAILTLDDLVTPGGLASFLDAFIAKTRWHLPTARAADAEALLPWATIEALLANSLVPLDCFRVVVNSNELPQAVYSDKAGRLRPDVVQGFATQGATLAINDIGGMIPAIGELATAVERDLRCRVNVNCYVTFGAASAFLPHHDRHDVLALQINGSKRWQSFGTPIPFPVDKIRPSATMKPLWEGLMTPGDLLFLPRGEFHAAVPEIRPSVHLTFGLYEATGVDFLQWLATRVTAVEALRRDLGSLLSGKERLARDDEFALALRALLDETTVADFFDDQDRERPLRPLAGLGAIGAGRQDGRFAPAARLVSALRRRVDLAAETKGEILLTLGQRQLRLSQLSRRALGTITGHNRVTVAALASVLDHDPAGDEFVACLDDLVAKSLIAIVA
jgi:hypothetical protein